MTAREIEAMRALYGSDADRRDIAVATFTAQLNDIGDCLSAQLCDLSRDFTPERAERMCIALEGVQHAIRRMMREVRA